VKSSIAKAWTKWKQWREMASLVSNRSIALKIRGSVHESCVRSVILYGGETWALTWKLEDVLNSCDSRMLRYMAGVRWQDRISSKEVAKRCGLKMIQDKLRQKRVQWFGHVRRETEGVVLRLVGELEVSGKGEVGRPRKTWKDLVKRDLELIGVDESVALNRGRWRKIIASPTPA